MNENAIDCAPCVAGVGRRERVAVQRVHRRGLDAAVLDKYLSITLSNTEVLSPEIRNIYKINVSLLLPSTSARLQAGGHGLIEWQSLASHHQFVTGVTYRSVTCLPATIFEHRCCYRPVDRFGIHFPMLLERIFSNSQSHLKAALVL